MQTPIVGQWYMTRDSSRVAGLCVAVLPSGDQCVCAARDLKTGKVTERVFDRKQIKGPMRSLPYECCPRCHKRMAFDEDVWICRRCGEVIQKQRDERS